MCEKIRSELSKNSSPLYIGILGIGYNPNNTGYNRCVKNPKEDIIYVKDLSFFTP